MEEGIELKINKHYVNADFKILTGFIKPHNYAGFSRGRKSIVPGLCNAESFKLIHGVDIIGHPKTMVGSIEHNPFHRLATDVLKKVGTDFIVNIASTIHHEMIGVFCGNPQEAFLSGVNFMREKCKIKTASKYDIAITHGNGYPFDEYFYQLAQCMSTPVPYLKSKGEIICVTSFEKGLGINIFHDLIKGINNLMVVARISKTFQICKS